MATEGGPPRSSQEAIDRGLRTDTRIYVAILAASMLVVLATAIPGLVATNRAREAQRARFTTVDGVVVDGRGTAPDTSELLIAFWSGGRTYEEWMRTTTFRAMEPGRQVEVAYPIAAPGDAQLANECTCVPPSGFPVGIILLFVVAITGLPAALQLWSRSGSAQPTVVPPAPVRAWWGGPRSASLRLYAPGDSGMTGGASAAPGRLVGGVTLPRSYRAVIADGDTVWLTGGTGLRGARLTTTQGPVPGRLILSKPETVIKLAKQASSSKGIANLGRKGIPLSAAEGRRLDRIAAVTGGFAPLIVLVLAFRLPAPWSFAAVLSFVPIAVGVIGNAWARSQTTQDERDEAVLAQRGLLPPPVLRPTEPPLPPPPSDDLRVALLGDHRTFGEAANWFGGNLSIAMASIFAAIYLITAPVLIPVILVAAIAALRGGAGRKARRYRRPGWPPWVGLALLTAAALAWLQARDVDGHGFPMALRAGFLVLSVAGGLCAFRIATAGVSVGRDVWVVRNLRRRVRIPGAEVAAVSLRPNRGFLPSAGLIIHRRADEPVVVGRFTLSRIVAKRLVRDLDAGAIGRAQPGTSTPPVPPPPPSAGYGLQPTPYAPTPFDQSAPYGRIF